MIKMLLILLVGLIFESAGVVFLKKGMVEIGGAGVKDSADFVRVVKAGAANPRMLVGVLFEAFFFASLLLLMSKSDISFLWPLTGLSFVFATFAAVWFLHERVSGMRWVGVVLIMLGAALISYSEHSKPKAEPNSVASTP